MEKVKGYRHKKACILVSYEPELLKMVTNDCFDIVL